MSGLLINYNAAAVAAYNNLDQTSTSLTQTVGQLSSGLQIQSAADNPAGYVVGQSLQMEANGYTQAISNAQDAVSVLQTAQGALGQEATILQTMNTLATQAANGGSQSTSSQAAAQAEFASLTKQLDQIASSTNYGGTSLLNGSYAGTFQVGPYNQTVDQISVAISSASSASLLGSTALSLTSTTGAQAAMSAVQAAIGTVATIAASVGASQNEITAVSANLTTAQQNIQSAHANLVDVNVAQMTSQFTSQQILEQAGVSILAQASQLPSMAQKLLP
ncbi:MAG: flagellin N-terminal helical domain-containing protein [Acidimicrobiales bacterium]